MSATINRFCTVKHLDDAKKSLIPEEESRQEALRDDDWDNRWNWDTSEVVYNNDEDANRCHAWLADCKIALSPFNDMFVIGRGNILTIFNLKRSSSISDDHDNGQEFNLIYDTSLPGLEPGETITSIVLLPFVSQQKSSINCRDWTAILIGFSTGFFRIYAENGKVLMTHLFHAEQILDIKCRTYCANNLLSEQLDEILIVYPTAVIQIDGFTLYQTLRLCRNHLAKSQHVDSAGQGFFQNLADAGSNSNHTPFTFKKWAFETLSDGQIQDCVDVCSFVKNDFDALVSHSITNQPLNNSTANLFMTTGTNPFVGFYRAQEGTTHTIIQELSQVLFNKVKNVFSFLSQSKPKETDPREMIKPATNVDCSLGLYDERLGFKICLSPNRRLAAVVDDFGRVTLFDLQNSIPIRIWKGYRRAEVGWIVVDEDSTGTQQYSKQAHFLVIYAPKRGIVEIWCAQNGPRVTAFNVGKNCQLLYMDHIMFGLNHLILQNIKQSMKHSQFSQMFSHSKCLLFNYETGELFNINIPFLCALTDRNGKKTRDIHILKDLKSLLNKYKENVVSEEMFERYRSQLVTLVLMLKTAEIRREFLEELIKMSEDENLIKLCASELHRELLRFVDKNQLDFENKLVAQMCVRIVQICDFYIKIREQSATLIENVGRDVEQSHSPPDIYQLTEKLAGWNGNDIARILSLLAFRQSVLKSVPIQLNQIKEEVNFNFTVSEMLSHFTLYYSHLIKKNNVEIYEKLPIEIVLMDNDLEYRDKSEGHNSSLTTQQLPDSAKYISLDRLSRFLFNATFSGDDSNLDSLLNHSCIFPSNLLLLLFTGWLNSSFSNYWPCWHSFHKALFRIVEVMNDLRQSEDSEDNLFFDSSNFDDRLLSPGWTDIVELIYKSENITSALISVNMIKALINRFKLDQKDITQLNLNEQSSELDDEDAEGLVEDVDKGQDLLLEKSLISSDNEWETLHLDKENLSLLTKQLEDLFLLDMLLKSNLCSIESQLQQQQQKKNATDDGNPDNESKLFLELRNQLQFNLDNLSKSNTVSLTYILNSGPGIVSEIVARWAVFHKIEPELLICQPGIDANDLNEDKESVSIAQESRELKRTVEGSTNAVSGTNQLTDQSTLMDILEHVRRCFPNCLESDILLINCGWELLLQWHRQPLIFSGELLLTLDYLNQVSSSVLKHNVASMGWRLFIQKRFEILCNLIEKMGKKPKDRICRKDLNMDENTLEQFVTFCCEFLDFMIRTSLYSEMDPLPLYSIDDWWCGFNASNDHTTHYDQQTSIIGSELTELPSSGQVLPFNASNAPLAVLAMHQKAPNVDLLIEYHRLASAVQFSVLFSLKSVRPLSLFPSTVRAYFFKDLHSFIASGNNDSSSKPMPIDPVLCETRFRFISNLITAIVQTLPVYQNESDRDEGHKFYLMANKWFGKIIDLAREWNLDVDKIRLRYVYDLFLFGCDPLAEELLTTVTDVKGLGRQLLVIAGMRLLSILNNRYSSLDEVSFLPPNIIFWLKSLVTDPNCYGDCPPSATALLLEHIANFLHDDSVNGRICEELLSAMQNKVLTGSMD